MMRRIFQGIIALVFCAVTVSAQDHRERIERIEAIKVAFITSKLDLTSEESRKFWPIYNNYQKEWAAIMRVRRELRSKSNGDANERINADLSYEAKIVELKKKYKKLYARAIPPEKILALYQAEREFREHLIQQLRKRREH